MVKAWLWNSYQGPFNEADFPEGEGYAYLGIENIYYNGSTLFFDSSQDTFALDNQKSKNQGLRFFNHYASTTCIS
jgi:hypothetical protein